MCSCFKVQIMVMNWVADLSQKIRSLVDIEGVMAMQEDAFDYVEHRLQIVGNSVDNQFQNVSANIEHQLQAIRANIQQYCSNFELNGSESVDTGNKNMEQTALKSSACSTDLSGEKDPKPADVEIKNTKDSNLVATALKKSACSLDLSEEKDSKPADVENKNIIDSNLADVETENTDHTDQENLLIIREPKTLRKTPRCVESISLEEKMNLAHAEYIIKKEREKYFKLAQEFESGKSKQKEYVALDFCKGRFPFVSLPDPSDVKADVIGENVKKQTLDGTHATIDNTSQCSLCFMKSKSGSDKKITCVACAAKVKLIDQQEHEQPTPAPEVTDNGLNLSEDEGFETADFDCDSDWEII